MRNKYENPLTSRYSSKEMSYIFSDDHKFQTFRNLWIALAKAEKELGLSISDQQIQDLERVKEEIDYQRVAEIEAQTRHDVMAHIKAYGELAPSAKGIIHWGATSCFVTDNTDLILMRDGLDLILKKLKVLIKQVRDFAMDYKDLPILAYTHYQPAQPTTLGKRASLWLYDLYMDYVEIQRRRDLLRLRGVKGTTGTQASFMELFEDGDKVDQLEDLVVKAMGFDKAYEVTGQTYSRKVDQEILASISSLAQTMHKMTNDLRMMQHQKEVEEPYEKGQVGSSAMAYKRNPMRSERISSLAKYVIQAAGNGALVYATQWFERTLDDSANRRISIGESFLAMDAILDIAINVSQGLVVHEKMIEKNLKAELPFMATENILMEAVKRGGDRQELHEHIRTHSQAAAARVKDQGLSNDLIDRIIADPAFGLSEAEIRDLISPEKFVGRSPQQVERLVKEVIDPILQDVEDYHAQLHV
ncbi:Adenylosuccinate lyase [Urinicoccus massiliensis]|uniref:Adenylosuccinate lyase n=1 Tax=Urinicoccus massiliensis TaxID=1723382 RepID=A0A8H2M5Z2_9FIRM|nr:adenylosuccinate lyase [Urinicoccus massiliensis]KGF09855.1 adenylosuccinate lyase [Tissierellia bacterium S5-A11]VFB17019.1 Adenylosuccinate lyase [Urinicoccus massiliensis]